MGMWIELGIFIVVLAWGFWQLYDVKQAKAQRIAEEARRASAQATENAGALPEASDDAPAKSAPLPLPPA